jgi:hypothetical protein
VPWETCRGEYVGKYPSPGVGYGQCHLTFFKGQNNKIGKRKKRKCERKRRKTKIK